ncbi:MAG: hypothetical protein WD533_07180 [Dehalococcoidia bacterium]
MADCTHHWKQEPGETKAPFICLRCGAERRMPTNFQDLMEVKTRGPVTAKRGDRESASP